MTDAWLECAACGLRLPVGAHFRGCPDCRARGRISPLEVQYNFTAVSWPPQNCRQDGIWRWSDLLPPVAVADRLTLGEGDTSLVKLPLRKTGGVVVWLKNETQNPTWSWKDRPNCISVSVAKELGFQKVAAISTGNHGCAVAAYAAAGDMSSTVFCHERAPASQLRLMESYGARTIQRSDAERDLDQLLKDGDHFPCSILCPRAGYSNPFGVEGFKTIAFELFAELGERLPTLIFMAAGSGDGIYGIWKGFRELSLLGLLKNLPRMVACQAVGADSLARAFRAGSRSIKPLPAADTIALSVCEKVTGEHALRAVHQSNGYVLTATDTQIEEAGKSLARMGYALEPASALTFACWQANSESEIGQEPSLLIGSGSAVKWMGC